jgi:hypothetical protein
MGDMTFPVALSPLEFGESGGPSARGSTPGGVKVAAGYSSKTEAAENFAAEHPARVCIKATSVTMRTASGLSRRCSTHTVSWTFSSTTPGSPGQDGSEDDRGGLGPGVAGKPIWGVLPVEGDSAAHARPRIRPDHQDLLHHRGVRQYRAGFKQLAFERVGERGMGGDLGLSLTALDQRHC